jgi:hypothetical protein
MECLLDVDTGGSNRGFVTTHLVRTRRLVSHHTFVTRMTIDIMVDFVLRKLDLALPATPIAPLPAPIPVPVPAAIAAPIPVPAAPLPAAPLPMAAPLPVPVPLAIAAVPVPALATLPEMPPSAPAVQPPIEAAQCVLHPTIGSCSLLPAFKESVSPPKKRKAQVQPPLEYVFNTMKIHD